MGRWGGRRQPRGLGLRQHPDGHSCLSFGLRQAAPVRRCAGSGAVSQ